MTVEGLDKIEDLTKALEKAGNNFKQEMFLPKVKVAENELKALFDALYRAKEEKDQSEIKKIIEEINALTKDGQKVDFEKEMTQRYAKQYLENIFKV